MSAEIFVALSTFAKYGDAPLKLLKNSGFTHSLNPLGRRLVKNEIIKMGKDCKGIIAGVEPYDKYVLENMPDLLCISRCGAGIDNIDQEVARRRHVEIRNTPDVVIQPAVELTVAMIFNLLRKLTIHTVLLKAKKWKKKAGNLLIGKKVGILGLGRIGKKVAETLLKLDAQVYGADLFPDIHWAEEMGVNIVSTDELLRISDIVSIHLSFLKENPFFLSEKEISGMKRGAMVINVSRGHFVDETALFNALKSGQLCGAALDVFPEEPYAGKLCELENVILTPHIATLTEESRQQMELEAVQNLIDVLKVQLNV